MSTSHENRFPGESDKYRKARDKLLEAEAGLRQRLEEVAELRRALPMGGEVPENYVFEEVLHEGGARKVKLSELFGEDSKDSLLLYNFMYGPEWEHPCPLCTSIADGFDGCAHHVNARSNLVVVAKAPPEKLRQLITDRGWRQLRFLSSYDNTFNDDYHAQVDGDEDKQVPILHVFARRAGEIYHFWSSELLFTPLPGGHPRHVDMFWPMWQLFDLTPEGRGDFLPQLEY